MSKLYYDNKSFITGVCLGEINDIQQERLILNNGSEAQVLRLELDIHKPEKASITTRLFFGKNKDKDMATLFLRIAQVDLDIKLENENDIFKLKKKFVYLKLYDNKGYCNVGDIYNFFEKKNLLVDISGRKEKLNASAFKVR